MTAMVNMENYEEYMLMEADGELNEDEQKALYAFMGLHPELKKELDAYKAAHLLPDEHMVYAEKETLLKQGKNRSIALNRKWIYAAAAMLLIFLSVGFFRNNTPEHEQPIAVNNTDSQKRAPIVAESPGLPSEDTGKIIHSSPANPIAYEKQLQDKPRQKKIRAEKLKLIKPIIEEDYIANTRQDKQTSPDEETPKPDARQQDVLPIAVNTPKTEQILTENQPGKGQQEDKKGQTWLPIKEERLAGLNDFSAVVGERIEQAKELKSKIKDSDITFKLGKKELFVVRL